MGFQKKKKLYLQKQWSDEKMMCNQPLTTEDKHNKNDIMMCNQPLA